MDIAFTLTTKMFLQIISHILCRESSNYIYTGSTYPQRSTSYFILIFYNFIYSTYIYQIIVSSCFILSKYSTVT